MRLPSKMAIVSTALLLLSACQPTPRTYDELMTHPEAMQRLMARCQNDEAVGIECDTVRRAVTDFSNLVSERADNPEAFGTKVLLAEMHLGDAEMALQQAGDNSASVDKARKNYADEKQKTAVLLAVVSATSLVGN